jgi:organic radical activating enzyme
MIFDNKIHNFKEYFNRWDLSKQSFVLFGASKECIQLIRTVKIILPEYDFKIKYLVDLDKEAQGSDIKLYDINKAAYKSEINTDILSDKRFEVKSFEDYLKDKDQSKIIITSDAYYNKMKEILIENDRVEDIDFTKYRKVAGIWPLHLKNQTHLWRADILLTEKCTLNCTFCNMYMPHYKKPKHKDLEKMKEDIDILFKNVDYMSTLHLVGGEPFLYPNHKDIFEYIGENYRDRIDNVLITTNGTLVPKPEVLDLIKKYNFLVSISDYTDGINYKRRFDIFIKKLDEKKVNYFTRKDILWSDFGDPRVSKYEKLSEEEMVVHFNKCVAPYRGLSNKKLYFCHLNTSAVLSEILEDDPNDFIDLENTSPEELIKFDVGFIKKGYLTFCKNCNGCYSGIEIPVSPADQGTRPNPVLRTKIDQKRT